MRLPSPVRSRISQIAGTLRLVLRTLRRRRLLVLAIVIPAVAVFVAGTYHGRWTVERHRPTFHDMIVNHAVDYRALVAPGDHGVQALADRFSDPAQAFEWVRDRIVFDPSSPSGTPAETLAAGRASCLGKASLLCSIYRAMGFPAEQVHVVVGEVVTPRMTSEHAWIEIEDFDGSRLQQDPTTLIATFRHDSFPGNSYAEAFVRKEAFCFNDHGFALVSQLNRLGGRAGAMNGTGTLPAP